MNNIVVKDNVFLLNTDNTSYLFYVDKFKHLQHLHYGKHVCAEDYTALSLKTDVVYGDSVFYSNEDPIYCLDVVPQELGCIGTGDSREPAISIQYKDSYTSDFIYQSYQIIKEDVKIDGLPSSYGCNNTLIIHLKDFESNTKVNLYYMVYPECDVITRRCVVINDNDEPIVLTKLMSLSVDMLEKDLVYASFHGGWSNEMNMNENKLEIGSYVNCSRVGFSSSKVNPAFYLRKDNTDEDNGEAWGFNLVYSGAHYQSVSLDERGSVRVLSGINCENMHRILNKNQQFCTPEAIMTYSSNGLNEMSAHFHDFINEHIVRGPYKKKERPVLINSWEAFAFDFNKDKILTLADEAKDLGIELLVLDDGWFIGRNNDTAGLGDYDVNLEKLPGGLSALSAEVKNRGLKFGIWLEPEAVNPNSNLYRKHPEWAIKDPGHRDVYGRNELLLDLTKKEVRDYIVENVNKVLDESKADYIKWDMNRQSIAQADYNHDYIIGLYEVLDRVFKDRNILFESCSSGGNRFDLGMLCYSPQIWASDNTDAIERIRMQKNYSYFYPLSTIGSHVSASVSSQALRNVPINTRFNVSCFGDLGYELDLSLLTELEKEEVKKQVEFYKQHRQTFQYGRFYRVKDDENKESFQVSRDVTIVGKFRRAMHTMPGFDQLKALNLPEGFYNIDIVPYKVPASRFGQLMRKANVDFLEVKGHHYQASNNALKSGIKLHNLYNATGINENVRIPLDFGSELYVIKK